MVHVHKDFDAVPKSLQLTEEEYALLKQGKELDKSYYEQDVLDALNEVYGGKCGYCEQKIKNINRYNIFHYRPIKLYPWLKYEWSNLLLVCEDCFQLGRFYSYIFPSKYMVFEPPINIKDWRANSEVFLSEKPFILNPEIDNPELFFDLDITATLLPKLGNLRALFTIHFAGLNRHNLIKNRKRIIHTYLKDDDDFFHNQTKEKVIEELEVENSFLFTKKYVLKNEDFLKNDYKSFKYSNNKKSTRGNWLTSITITQLRHLRLVSIPLSEKEKKHLILTGKNGSGKTTVLNQLNEHLIALLNYQEQPQVQHIKTVEGNLRQIIGETKIGSLDFSPFLFGQGTSDNNVFKWDNPLFFVFNRYTENVIEQYRKGEFIYLYFPDVRLLEVNPVDINVNGEINLKRKINDTRKDNLSQDLQNFLVRLNIAKIFETADENLKERKLIESWLEDFIAKIREVSEDDSVSINFPRKGLDFGLEIKSKKYNNPLSFEELPMGYSALLKIVVEIILNVVGRRGWQSVNYDMEGIVLIDEVSAHLHVNLQKQVLPILTSFFPNIQFIVTTHSPFVLNSIENAVIYDLETNMRLEDASSISYSGLIEGFFNVPDEYSEIIKRKVAKYERLVNMDVLTESEEDELGDLDIELDNLSPLLSTDMYAKFKNAQKKVFKTAV